MGLADYRESEVYSDLEKLVLDYTVALTRTPAEVADALVEDLREHISEEALVELSASIAWKNFRARFNRGFDTEAQGFSQGACCPLPEGPRQV